MSIQKLVRKYLIHSKYKFIARVFDNAKRSSFFQSRFITWFYHRHWQNDRAYIIQAFKEQFGRSPNLDTPVDFNEKNNWRKLYDRKAIYTKMVDKKQIKEVIAQRVGLEHTFPLLGVWDDPGDIDFSKLPDQFVLKANHAGGVIVCRDKSSFDVAGAIKELRKTMKLDYFYANREWPYKNVERKIICEAYMGENLTDYKNYCFNGKLQYTFVWENESREDGRKPEAYFCGAYDRQWQKSGIEIDYPTHDKLVEIAEKMSAGIPFVRVDCYIINHHVYVGEMTFFPWGGFMKLKDETWNRALGNLEQLPAISETDL